MTDQNMGHPTLGRRRRTHHCTVHQPCQCLDWQTTLMILRSVLRTRKVEKKRSDRSQSRLLLSLLPADTQMSMMRLWESVKWILGTERFEEGLDSEYHDAAEEPADISKPEPEHMSYFSHGGCGSSSLRECLELLNQTRSNSPAPCL